VQALAARATPEDRAPANGSSIAFLLEHKSVTALLTADAHPSVLQCALDALAKSRRQPLPWRLDLMKLSHHGSRANTTSTLLQAVRAEHVIVSTNGAIFGHPNPEGIARVVDGCLPNTQIWFNYRTPQTEIWANEDLQRRFRYSARLADENVGGISVLLPQPK
jgi:beta-lactamase superfamily II metal-dependent hydrolase